MSNYAINTYGKIIYASDFSDDDWMSLKNEYVLGEFIMPCCLSPAIPKTSPNFTKFFSHKHNECSTNPETIWHREVKEQFYLALISLGIAPRLEFCNPVKPSEWRADIYFEINDRKICIEIQHSYQHLRTYLKRQERYKKYGIECYWLVYPEQYGTLTMSIARKRLRYEFNNNCPDNMNLGSLSTLPALHYNSIERMVYLPSKGKRYFESLCYLEIWLCSLIMKMFKFDNNYWIISN